MGILDVITGSDAAAAATRGGEQQIAGLQQGIDYSLDANRFRTQYGDEALQQYGDIFTGDMSGQQQLIDRALASPLYSSIMGNRELGEEAIMRNASATGGLRTGNVNASLYDFNQRFGADALQTAYADQLTGLTNLMPMSGADPSVTRAYGDMGTARGGATIGAANARGAGVGNIMGMGLDVGAMMMGMPPPSMVSGATDFMGAPSSYASTGGSGSMPIGLDPRSYN